MVQGIPQSLVEYLGRFPFAYSLKTALQRGVAHGTLPVLPGCGVSVAR